jgi:hypothetical protein
LISVTEEKSVDFIVRLVGSDVKPWKVPMRSLSRLMDAIQRLVEQSDGEDTEPSADEQENQDGPLVGLGSNVLKLVGIRAQSAGYAISTPFKENALSLLASTGRAIENPADSEWSAPTIASLRDVSEIAKGLGVKVEIRKPTAGGKLGEVIAKITPLTYENIASAAFVRGNTTLYGTVERIGGASEARCAFRLPDEGKLLYCGVAGDELAKKLSLFLYQDVSIHGEATWLRANWRICNFEITAFDPPKTGSFQDALADIWKAGGKAWDKIDDPKAFIAEIRG